MDLFRGSGVAIVTPFNQDGTVDFDKLGESIGVSIKCQREEIFDMMHRI